MEELEQSCTKCKHYVQHFIKYKTYLQRVGCGHCKGKRLTLKEQRSFPFMLGCELWEQAEPITYGTQKEIVCALKEIYERLNNLIMILNDNQ